MLLDRNNGNLNISNTIKININNEINDYQFTFDVTTETEIRERMEDILKNKVTPPTWPPPYIPQPLLTEKEIEIEKNEANESL